MNIIVKTASGHIIVRPDTTWEKDNEDVFPQDFIDTLTFAPVMFARVCKPGKCIGTRFADRYYDSVNFGVLLYPENLIGTGSEDFAAASCIDHTSFLPAPLYQKCVAQNTENEFVLMREGSEIFRINAGGTGSLEAALTEASGRIYLRTGDLVAVELSSRNHLWSREDGIVNVQGTFCENQIIDFNIR